MPCTAGRAGEASGQKIAAAFVTDAAGSTSRVIKPNVFISKVRAP